MAECGNGPGPADWHVSPVSEADDRRMREIMEAAEERTGERQSKSGTLRRALRALWVREIDPGGDQGV